MIRTLTTAALAAVVTCAVLPASTALAGPDDPGPADLAAWEYAIRSFATRVDPSLPDPPRSIRELRAAIPGLFVGLSPWDYYGQRGNHFSGEVAINPADGSVSGTISVSVTVVGNGHDSLYFWTSLPITAVRDGSGADVSFEETYSYGIKLTRIDLDTPPADGDQFEFSFDMDGKPECNYEGAFSVNLCGFDTVSYLAMDIFLPGSLAGDFATLDLDISVPAGLTLASSGITTSVVPSAVEGWETHHVVQDFETEAHSLTLADFEAWKIPHGEQYVGVYAMNNPLFNLIIPDVMSDMRDILEFYSDNYGEFIYPKMEASQVNDDAGAAFGWPALLWIPDSMMLMGGSSGGGGHGADQRTALFAHELGHQWFPDMVKNDDPWAAWLSEGWAEFSSIYYMSRDRGEDYLEGIFDYYGMLYRYFIPYSMDYGLTSKESNHVSDGWVYQIVTYFKGAVVANTIRQVIGHEAFIEAIQNLYNDFAGKDDYYDTGTLQIYFQNASGQDLQWLFDQWVFGKGFPIYTVDVRRTVLAEGSLGLEVRVRRDSNQEGVVFSMPINIQVSTENGDTDNVVMVDQDDMTFSLPADGRVSRIRFDPDRTFIKHVIPGLAGDVDLSGEVDGIDLIYTAWAQEGRIGESPNFLPWVDFDRDGLVGKAELDNVTDNFGSTEEEVAP